MSLLFLIPDLVLLSVPSFPILLLFFYVSCAEYTTNTVRTLPDLARTAKDTFGDHLTYLR